MRKDLYITPELYKDFENLNEYLCQLEKAHLDANGYEVPNPKPLVLLTGLGQPLTLQQQIKRLFRNELSNAARRQGHETEAEANDFEVFDAFDSEIQRSKYEVMTDDYPQSAIEGGNASSNSPSQEKTETPSSADQAPTVNEASE